ncbi:putative sporulation protein YlmC/YmxH [Gottschalkia acidurici 9a]|uniref:Sporulation protein YlmC/YmxH n=1 Tax=Gottschalkia acidurici (strain ATCC 7906 / DSM 604 / BCRC 14475 / CIP 104303 / KCTC 5404 / NCIMB 10678 / 9a) TaxID=1128398 RepID=K0AZV8_GOTA9|nr:YlmC/YmxH family sporulation protein [Gottschalkia acidurici]AFS78322.1 putative sporulation protein YlmC/YmxH [Gottschalkia acidurici 9a]
MIKASDLREKEVINIRDGTRLGLIEDVEVNLEKGIIEAIIVPGSGSIFSLFSKSRDYIIGWRNITRIGSDVILVDLNLSDIENELI